MVDSENCKNHLQDFETYIPKGIGKLKLCNKNAGIAELKDLVNLRGELCIRNVHDVVQAEDAEAAANLKEKENLSELILECCDDINWRGNRDGTFYESSL